MNKKNLRTSIVVAVLLAGLLVGASFALAQDSEEAPATDEVEATLDEILEDFETDIAPLVDEIQERALTAIDDAVASGALTEEQGEAAREHVEGYRMPEGFPLLPHHRLPWLDLDGFDPGCFGFGAEAEEKPDDCPELPEAFPFGGRGFEFGPMPHGFEFEDKWEHFGDEIEGFLDGLDFDIEQLEESLESGLSLEESLDEMGIDLETVLSGARADALEKIDDLVADGTIPEDKAERIKDKLEGIDFSSGFPFGFDHFEFDSDAFDEFWSHGQGFFDHHADEEPGDE